MNPGYRLLDAEEIEQLRPGAFPTPDPEAVRRRVKSGDLVTLMFVGPEEELEPMWVAVAGTTETGFFGTLDSVALEPVVAHGELVEFEPRHVLFVHRPGSLNDLVPVRTFNGLKMIEKAVIEAHVSDDFGFHGVTDPALQRIPTVWNEDHEWILLADYERWAESRQENSP